MPEPRPKRIRQYAPVKFGEPFNPQSVDGVQARRQQAASIRRRKQEEAELAEIDAKQAAVDLRLAARSPLTKLWERLFG